MTRIFRFKQFQVDDHGCGMPVSTDGVLLGAWAKMPQQGKVVDIGTGSGLLALMAAQRTHLDTNTVHIDAIELDHQAACAAQMNFTHSPWSNRLNCIEQDVMIWSRQQSASSIASIITNPPYFNFGQQAEQHQRATARHTDTLSHQQLLQSISYLLDNNGTASLILPYYEGKQLMTHTQDYGLFTQTICEVRSTEHKSPIRLLLQLGKNKQEVQEQQLCIHHNGSYSSEFIELTKDFYLKM